MRLPLFCASLLVLAACSPSGEEAAGHDASGHDMMTTQVSDEQALAGDTAPLPRDGVVPVIEVRSAWMRPHPQGRDITAAYIVVQLAEGSADRFTGAEVLGASHVELHGHAMGEGGMMRMREIGPQRLTDEGPLVFTPGGRHLMVHGLAAVSEGESVEGWLVFERAGRVPVTFQVRSAPPGSPSDAG